MADDRLIDIAIDPKGKTFTVDFQGFHGVGCKAIAEAFDSMGTTVSSVEKDEVYETYNQNVLTQGR